MLYVSICFHMSTAITGCRSHKLMEEPTVLNLLKLHRYQSPLPLSRSRWESYLTLRWNLSEYSSPSEMLSASPVPWCVDRSRMIPSKLLNPFSQSAITDLVRHSDAIDDRKLFVSTILMIWNSTRIGDDNLVAWACPCVYLYYEGGPSCNRG